MADSNLAATIATEYGRMLHQILPKVEDALKRGKTSASFQVTAKFRVNVKTGGVDVNLTQTASIPMESVSFKLSYNSGQLSLFEATSEDTQRGDSILSGTATQRTGTQPTP